MRAEPYTPRRRAEWDAFVRASRNGTFLLERGFMDYHADRFQDCSLMVYEGERGDAEGSGELVALFPANWEEGERTVCSHRGLTYGGLLTAPGQGQRRVMEALAAVMAYCLRMLGARRLVYRAIPYIYTPAPAQEDLYALTLAGARLAARAVSSAVSLRRPPKMRALRMRQARKALEHGLYVELLRDGDRRGLAQMWELLTATLAERHGVRPVHSEEEMALLMSRFPASIKVFLARGAGGEALAGTVLFLCRGTAHAQYIAAGPRGRELGALDLIFRHLITERLCQMEYLDFGVSTERGGLELNEGLIFQKEGFGASGVCYDTYELPLSPAAIARLSPALAGEGGAAGGEAVPYLPLGELNARFAPQLARAVGEAALSGIYLRGGRGEGFARAWADYCGARHCVPTGSGLSALALCLRACALQGGWGPGAEVIVPANTFVATVLAVWEAGLAPVLCDPSPEDGLMHARDAEALLTERTRAIVPVHLYGRVCDMAPLRRLAGERGLRLVEDAAQAHGAIYRGERAGHLGDAAAFSFYPSKNLGALGDAGAVVTDDGELARLCLSLGNYGYGRRYECPLRGTNSRMDEVQAAALMAKLPALDADNERRRALARLYSGLIDNPLVRLPGMPRDPGEHVFHIFALRCPARDQLREHLRRRGVETLVHYPVPPHLQPGLAPLLPPGLRLPWAERLARETLSLPLHPLLTDGQARRVAGAVQEFNTE